MKPLPDMTRSELVRVAERSRAIGTRISEELIANGYGNVVHSELLKLAHAPDASELLVRWREHEAERCAIRDECRARERYHGTLHRIIHK